MIPSQTRPAHRLLPRPTWYVFLPLVSAALRLQDLVLTAESGRGPVPITRPKLTSLPEIHLKIGPYG